MPSKMLSVHPHVLLYLLATVKSCFNTVPAVFFWKVEPLHF